MADMNLGTLTVLIEASTDEFKKSMSDVSTSMEDLSSKMAPVAVAAGVAFAGITGSVGFMVKAAADAEAAQIRLGVALKATGSNVDPKAYDDLAASIEKMSTFDDDAAIASAALLTKLHLTEGQIKGLLPLAADYAAFIGSDLPSASEALGRAIATGQVGMLTRAGVAFDEATKAAFQNGTQAERTAIVMDVLKNSVGGTAQALSQTASGAFLQMEAQLGNLAETVGGMFEPVVVAGLHAVMGAVVALKDFFAGLSDTQRGLIVAFTAVAAGLTGVLTAVLAVVAVWPQLVALFASAEAVFAAIGPEILVAVVAIGALTGAAIAANDAWKDMGGNSEDAMNSVVASTEFAIGSLLGLQNEGYGLFSKLGTFASDFKQFAKDDITAIGDWLKSLIPQAARDAFDGAKQGVSAFGAFVQNLIPNSFMKAFNAVKTFVGDLVMGIAKAVGQLGVDIFNALTWPLRKFVSIQAEVLGTAFDYWKGKLADLGGAVSVGAPSTGSAGGGGGGGRGKGTRAEVMDFGGGTTLQDAFDELGKSTAMDFADLKSEMEGTTGLFSDLNQELLDSARVTKFQNASKAGAMPVLAAFEKQGEEFVNGASGALYNVGRDVFGPNSKVADAAGAFGEVLDKVGGNFASTLTNGLGAFGGTMNAALQGGMQAGPMGAAVAALGSLIVQTPQFAKISEVLNDSLKNLLGAIGSLLDGIMPLVRAVGSVVATVGAFLKPVFESLGGVFGALGSIIQPLIPILGILQPLFQLLGTVLQEVARVLAMVGVIVLSVVKGLADAWNGILSTIQSVFKSLGGIEVFGGHPLGFLNDWADDLDKAKAPTEGLKKSLDDLDYIVQNGKAKAIDVSTPKNGEPPGALPKALGGAAGAADKFADAANKATASMTNVPTGFKVLASRFAATMPSTSMFGENTPGAGSGGASVRIDKVEIKSDNPEKIWRSIKDLIAWDNFANTGSSVAATNPYAIQKTGT